MASFASSRTHTLSSRLLICASVMSCSSSNLFESAAGNITVLNLAGTCSSFDSSISRRASASWSSLSSVREPFLGLGAVAY